MLKEKLTQNAQDEFILANIVEKMTRRKVDELISGIDMCSCEKCRLNACAIALNSLPPHYVTTTKGALLAEIDSLEAGYRTNITIEVTKALMIVSRQPLH